MVLNSKSVQQSQSARIKARYKKMGFVQLVDPTGFLGRNAEDKLEFWLHDIAIEESSRKSSQNCSYIFHQVCEY